NVISGNTVDGINIIDSATSGNIVEGNYIGLDRNGAVALPNFWGVVISNQASGNTIGGSGAGDGNTISGNTTNGVLITGPNTNDNVIQGNSIGTDPSGSVAIANGESGIRIDEG